MEQTQTLDLPATNDVDTVPRAIVSKIAGNTRLQLPFEVFNRSQTHADGRTYNFFTDEGSVHEGEKVIIFSYGDHTEVSAQGTVQRARVYPSDKWFVQTPVQSA